MGLNDLINLKKELEDIYYDPKEEVFEAIPDEKDFEKTLKYLSSLYQNDELIKELLIENDIKSLSKYLKLNNNLLINKYGQSGKELRKLCKKVDYTLISVYFVKLYESVINNDIDLTDKELCGKVNMLFDFYTDILKHDFRKVFEYTQNCDLLNNLCLLVETYQNQIQRGYKKRVR